MNPNISPRPKTRIYRLTGSACFTRSASELGEVVMLHELLCDNRQIRARSASILPPPPAEGFMEIAYHYGVYSYQCPRR